MKDREKIAEIIKKNGTYNGRSLSFDYYAVQPDDLAKALIAAGIGDVSRLREHRVIAEYSLVPDDDSSYIIPNVPLRVTQLYSGEEVEDIAHQRDEYKHRAEVAEKMFDTLYEEISEYMRVLSKEWYKHQAEKELAEDGKDD